MEKLKTTEAQRKAVREYEKNNYRLNIVFPKGTKERIEALNLNKTNSAFIRDTVISKLDELEKILKNAEVIVEDEVDLDKINIGCQVKILDIEMNQELDYKIVGSTEANSLKGKISNESPVGRALIGAKTGDIVRVETPGGELEYQVLEIQRAGV